MENGLLELINALNGECPACYALVIGQGGHKSHCRAMKALIAAQQSEKRTCVICGSEELSYCEKCFSENLDGG